MAWTDSQGRTFRGRKSNGWPYDTKAPDGGLVYGFRLVRNGRVRFAGCWWTAPELASREGEMVRVETTCPFWLEAKAHLGTPGTTPENYRDNQSSFYRRGIPLEDVGE